MEVNSKVREVLQAGRVGFVIAGMLLAYSSWAMAQTPHRMVGVTPVTSTVSDIPGPVVQQLFINALMQTNSFALRPPDAKGSYAGAEYVFQPTIKPGKAKTNVLGFLKDSAVSPPITLEIKVFEARTNAMVNFISIKSAEMKSGNLTLTDLQSMLGVAKADSSTPDEMDQLEERLGPMLLQAANQLAAQYGLGGATPGSPASQTSAGFPSFK